MGKNVFANGMEIVHKAGSNKVIAAFPDVCMSPPSPPAGPVPVPYPDTSMSDDLKRGSKSVKIGGQPVSFGAGARYWAESPTTGAHDFGARAVVTFLFPTQQK